MGLPARDLRPLDPALLLYHTSSGIMDRNRTVVVNVDRVRAVITMSEVLVPRPRDPAVTPTSPLPPRRPHRYRTASLFCSCSAFVVPVTTSLVFL
jgi:hypothetical protein